MVAATLHKCSFCFLYNDVLNQYVDTDEFV